MSGRILLLTPYLPPPVGGIEKELLSIGRELGELGHEVHVLSTTARFPSGRNPEPPADLPDGLRVVRLAGYLRSTLRGFAPARAPLLVPGLLAAARAVDPWLVLVFNVGWPLPLRPVLRGLRGRSTLLYRTYFHPPGGRLAPRKTRYLLGTVALADRAFVSTEGERRELAASGALAPERIAVVPPGVRLHEEEPGLRAALRARYGLEGKVVIAHTARLSVFKGSDDLVAVLPEVRARSGEDVVLLLIGSDREPGRLAALARAHGVEAELRQSGEIQDDRTLRALLGLADVFALPSAYEAFGIAYIEALAEGVPCVGCDVGGVREAIGDAGIVIPRHGDRPALANALVRLLGDRGARRELGARGARRVRSELTWRRTAERLLELAAQVERR